LCRLCYIRNIRINECYSSTIFCYRYCSRINTIVYALAMFKASHISTRPDLPSIRLLCILSCLSFKPFIRPSIILELRQLIAAGEAAEAGEQQAVCNQNYHIHESGRGSRGWEGFASNARLSSRQRHLARFLGRCRKHGNVAAASLEPVNIWPGETATPGLVSGHWPKCRGCSLY